MSPSAMKQMSCESGLRSDGQTATRCLGAYLRLGRVADREHRVGELRRREHSQDVGLVLTDVDRTHQTAVHKARIVARDDGVEPEREGSVEDRGKLDLLVTAQARVRSTTSGVFGDEVVDHVDAKSFGEIPDIERDIEDVGAAPSVIGVFDRAATAGAVPQARRLRRQRQVDAGDVVSSVDGASGGDGGVHPAAHRREHPHSALIRVIGRTDVKPARRARSTTGPIASITAFTSASVEVWPSENRNEPRALIGSAPIAIRTWDGRATPAEQAEPVEHSIPRASSSMSKESPSQPGKRQVGDSGKPFGRMSVDDDVRDGRPNSVDQAAP